MVEKIAVLLIATLLAAPLAIADEEAQKNPYSRGTAKKVSGILLTSVGPAIGAVFYLAAALHYCDGSTSDEECEKGAKEARTQKLTALAFSAGTIAAGTLLIISGSRDRTRWQAWEDTHTAAAPPVRQRGEVDVGVLLGPNTVGIGLSASL